MTPQVHAIFVNGEFQYFLGIREDGSAVISTKGEKWVPFIELVPELLAVSFTFMMATDLAIKVYALSEEY
jgi:hypothetical protein